MGRIASLLRRLWGMRWDERGLLLVATGTCVVMWGALRWVSFRRLVRWTGTVPPHTWTASQARIDRMLAAVRAVGHRLFGARPCLPTALAGRFLLAQCGVQTELRIGVDPERRGGTPEAHAWLERDGEVLLGGADAPSTYEPLTTSSEPT